MVAISCLLLAIAGITGALAAPAEERGPKDFFLEARNAVERRANINYYQNYTTGGQVNFAPNGGSFSVNWNTYNDFVVGVGWTTGSNAPINYGGSFSTYSGTGILAVYGWTTNPLVEYYVVESSSNFNTGGYVKGSVTTDGSSYTIWENTRVNQPSIVGTTTFNQYFSIRNSPRTSGTVSIANHFQAWRNLGLPLGQMNYQVIAIEGWGGSGSANQYVSN